MKMANKEQLLECAREANEEQRKQYIEAMFDDFLHYYYCVPCNGCPEGHSSMWKTVIESPQWKLWQKEQQKNPLYDMSECEELGIMSKKHFQDFLKFINDGICFICQGEFGHLAGCTSKGAVAQKKLAKLRSEVMAGKFDGLGDETIVGIKRKAELIKKLLDLKLSL